MTIPHNSNGSPHPMSCAEFQEQLPDLFAGNNGASEDPALSGHLATCENCSALVRDLQYIADQASLLLQPVEEEPSDEVWKKIQEGLKSDPLPDHSHPISSPHR